MKYIPGTNTHSKRISASGAIAVACICICLAPLVASADTFNGYQAGNWPPPTLSNSTDCIEGTDYTVTISNTGSPVTILSIHGGAIELHTTEISAALANLYGWNRYDFKAHGTARCLGGLSNVQRLHITATHFDDPRAVLLVNVPKAVAIHGYADSRGYARGVICVGGANASARSTFISQVNSNASSWGAYSLTPIDAPSAGNGACGDLPGTSSANIVNRTSSGGGLQLELSKGLRTDLANTSDHSYDALRNIVYAAIAAAMQTGGPGTVDASRYGFENGIQGWQSSGGAIAGVSSSNARSFFGQQSLAVSILNQADTQQAYVLSPDVPAGRTITFRVWVGTNGGVTAIQPYVLEGATGGWRWTGNYKTVGQLRPGEWNELQVVMPSNATQLYSLGVEFFSNGSTATTAYIDSINW